MHRPAALALVAALLGLSLAAPAPAQTAAPTAAQPVSAEARRAAPDGALLYHNYCSVCHGDRGDGRSRATGSLSSPPRDFTAAKSRAELDRARIVRAVTFGIPGTAMVAWTRQLGEADIAAVAEYVHTRFVLGQGGAEAANPAAAAATGGVSGTRAHGGRDNRARGDIYPEGLRGDAGRGAAYYRLNCTACHGEKGDGQGPRAYFIRPKPRDFLSLPDPARYDRALLFEAIADGRLGTEMPAWRQVLDAQQIADLAEYVLVSFVRPAAERAAAAPK